MHLFFTDITRDKVVNFLEVTISLKEEVSHLGIFMDQLLLLEEQVASMVWTSVPTVYLSGQGYSTLAADRCLVIIGSGRFNL